MAKTFRDLVKEARARIYSESVARGHQKEAFTPMGAQGAAAPAPAAPPGGMPMGGGAPMDPSMMGGAPPPMDPSMMGGGAPPMDPSMGGGAPPPMDPSMGGGGGTPVMLTMEDLVNLVAMITGGEAGAPPEAGGAMPAEAGAPPEAPNEPEKPEGGKGKATDGKLDAIAAKLDTLIGILGGAAGAPLDATLGGAPTPMGTGSPMEAPPPGDVMPPMPPEAAGGMPPGGMPPGGAPGMMVAASANDGDGEDQEKQASRSANFRLSRILRGMRNRNQ